MIDFDAFARLVELEMFRDYIGLTVPDYDLLDECDRQIECQLLELIKPRTPPVPKLGLRIDNRCPIKA
jgi:hypothetical protein